MHRANNGKTLNKIIALSLILVFGAAAIIAATLWGAPSIFATQVWDGRSKFPAFANLGNNATEFSSEEEQSPYTINGFIQYMTTVYTSDDRTILAPNEEQVKALITAAKDSGGQVMINLDQPGFLANGGKSQTFRVVKPEWYTASGSLQILLYSVRGSMEITDQMISALSSYEEYIDFTIGEDNQFDIRNKGKSIWQDGNVSMRIGLPYAVSDRVDTSAIRLLEGETGLFVENYEYTNGWLYGVLKASGKYDPVIERAKTLSGEQYYVTASRLNVRTGPGTSHGKITSISNGEVVSLLSIEGNWANISLIDGTIGWVSTKYITR